MPSFRLFVSIDTPPHIKPQIAAIRDQLKESGADVKWEPDEKLHATLKFLCQTDERLLPEIVSIGRGVCKTFTPLHVKYTRVGCFPNRRAPRIIWVGLDDLSGNMGLLQQQVETGMVPLGFKREEREFHSHITLGRVKSEKRIESLLRMMESITFESPPVVIKEIMLVKSDLMPSGSVYTTLNTFPLTA